MIGSTTNHLVNWIFFTFPCESSSHFSLSKPDNHIDRAWFFAWSHRWKTKMMLLESVLIHTRSDARCMGHIPGGIISLLTSKFNKRLLLSKGEPIFCLFLHLFSCPPLLILHPLRTSLINSIHQRRFLLDGVQVIPTSCILSQVVHSL